MNNGIIPWQSKIKNPAVTGQGYKIMYNNYGFAVSGAAGKLVELFAGAVAGAVL